MNVVLFLLTISLTASVLGEEPRPAFAEPQLTQPARISDPVPTWLARWELARALTYAEKYEESLGQYEKLLVQRPDLKESIQREMVTVLFWSDDKDGALQLLKELGSAADPSGKLLMADLLMADKKYDEAVAIYEALLKSDQENDEVRLRLAEVLSWQKKYAASIHHYQHILKRHPADNNTRKKYGMVLMWSGDQKGAIEQLQQALK